MRPAVVIPSNREVVQEQLDMLGDVDVLVVDGGGFKPPDDDRVRVLSMRLQQQLLGSDLDLVGHGSAACRNFGVWWAWQAGYDVIINLDDDCWPEPGLAQRYADILSEPHAMTLLVSDDLWVSTLHRPQSPWYPRGFPYEERLNHAQYERGVAGVKPVAHMGMWTGALDLNAVDKVAYAGLDFELSDRLYTTKRFFSVCAMNFAVARDFAPYVYQIPWASFAQTCALERYDDIVGGILACAFASLDDSWMSFGPPFVKHEKKDVDLLTHAARENFGNVLIGRLARLLDCARRTSGAGVTRRERALSLLDRFEQFATDTDLEPIVAYCVDRYRRWLELFK